MSSFKKHHSESAIEPDNAGLTQEPLLQIRSASVQANATYLAARGLNNSPALPAVADSAMSMLSSSAAEMDGDQLFAFYPSAGHPSDEHRPNLVDAVIEQLRHARLRRQRPH